MIVQPTFWVKGALQFSRALVSEKFWKKLHFAEDMQAIEDFFGPGIKLPEGIVKSLTIIDSASHVSVSPSAQPPAEPPKRRDIFGMELSVVMTHPMNGGLPMPLIFINCVKYLKKEGISAVGLFRVPGNKNLMSAMISSYDQGVPIDFETSDNGLDAADVGGIIKQYIRDLPNPLLNHDLYSEWVSAIVPDMETSIQTVKGLLSQLPPINQLVLSGLLHLLKQIADAHHINKMTPQNLAIVWGPNLLRGKDTSAALELSFTGQINALTVLLITRCLDLFPVDPFESL